MKRVALMALLLVLTGSAAWADVPFFSEDFTDGIPDDWSVVDNNLDDITWSIGVPSVGPAPTLTGLAYPNLCLFVGLGWSAGRPSPSSPQRRPLHRLGAAAQGISFLRKHLMP